MANHSTRTGAAPLRPKQQQPLRPKQQQTLRPKQQQPLRPKQQQPLRPKQQQPLCPKQQQPLRPKQQQPLRPKQQPSPRIHHRRSIRLKGYDYTQAGAYFVTIVTQDRAHLFGEVVNGEMRLNEYGQIVCEEWFRTAALRANVRLFDDEFVVMPNHIHGIIWITDDGNIDTGDAGVAGDDVGAQRRCAPTSASTQTIFPSTPTTSTTPTSASTPTTSNTHTSASTPTIPNAQNAPATTHTSPTIHDINVAPGSLGAIVRAFKSAVAQRINTLRRTPSGAVWQRNYYEHIIRNDDALNRIRQYIRDNPRRWELDRENLVTHPDPSELLS